MPQSKIVVNSSPGSSLDLPINTTVDLSNQNVGGELSYSWTLLDQPPGTTDPLSSATSPTPTFLPRKEGSYLVQLVVNLGLPTEQTNRVICAVKQLKTQERIPAAGETTESDAAEGWALSQNAYLRRIDALIGDPGVLVGVNVSGGTRTKGDVVRCSASAVIKSGLYGQETLPAFDLAHADTLGEVDELLCVVVGGPGATPSPTVPGTGSNEAMLMQVRYIGRYPALTPGGSATAGQTVYVNDAGALSLTEGTVRRRMGSAMGPGTTFDVWVDGVGGSDIDQTPIDRAYLVYGALGALPNGLRVDGSNSGAVSGGVPFQLRAGDINTVVEVLKRFSAAGLDIQQWQTEGGTTLARVTNAGAFAFANWLFQQIAATTVRILNADDGTGQSRYFELLSTSGSSPKLRLRLHDASASPSVVDFDLETGSWTGATMRIGSADATNDGGLRIRIKGADSWLFASVADGLDFVAPGTHAANVTNLRVPGAYDEAARRNYVDSRSANLIINGHFRYWQRGTTADLADAGGRIYVADRWYASLVAGTGEKCTYSRLTVLGSGTGAPANFKYAAKLQRPSPTLHNAVRALTQEINRASLLLLQNATGGGARKVAVQFWVLAGADFSGTLACNFITGATGTEFENAFDGYTGGNTVLSAAVAVTPGTWVLKRIPFSPGAAPVAAIQWAHTPASSASADDSFAITGVQLVVADSETDLATIPFSLAGGDEAGELALCEAEVEKSYNTDVDPADPTGIGESLATYRTLGSVPWYAPDVRFRVAKQKTPVITLYGHDASDVIEAGHVANHEGDATNLAAHAEGVGLYGFRVVADEAPSASAPVSFHWLADAGI